MIIALHEIDAGMADLVGGKAAGLGEMIKLGERVPDGFCLTGDAATPDILTAYRALGGGPVAVRSSATAEDLPGASFAGQYDTILNVTGDTALLDAVHRCRDSLHGPRATAYREAHHIDHTGVRMAVVVQRMVDSTLDGVLFTANPLTGRRTEMVVDAGTSVVEGATEAEHHVIDRNEDGTWLDPLRRAGQRLEDHFGTPQDIEWAIDRDGTLWLLQSRPITTLFPLPPDTSRPPPRAYVEFGHVQGMLQPVTPMGMATLKLMVTRMLAALGVTAEIVDIGGRLYGDLTDLLRGPTTRKRLVKLMAVDFGPRAQAAVAHLLTDPRFAPLPRDPARSRPSLRTAPRAAAGVLRALARPDTARARLFRQINEIERRAGGPGPDSTAAERLDFVEARDGATAYDGIVWPIMAGMLAAALPPYLLKGLATDAEIQTVLGGMPHNVTIEMDLALWRLAQAATAHRDLLRDTPPADLAAKYLAGTLPDIGLAAFLDAYGHRAAAEVDIGVPRWAEDPTPVFATIANYLRVTDPDQAPDRRFARAAAAAEVQLADLVRRTRRRPIRGGLAVFLLRRARALAGLREAGKFAGLYPLRETRRQLLLAGAELARDGLLDRADDIMFLTVAEARTAVQQRADHRDTIAARRGTHARELRRRTVPVAVLSDGTDVEALLPPPATDGALRGVGAAPGRVTGPARVVLDPATARVEPGEILVAPTTDPGWTPLFLTAGGLVTETGATMAHGPTVAREYGIPAVICVPAATSKIRTGQLITVDGTTGTVHLPPHLPLPLP